MKVRVTKRAQAQIDRAVQWWDGNGDLALKAFDEDLAKAFLLLSVEPGVGARVLHARAEGVRRLHLARVRYHLYYRSRGTPNLSLNPDASPAALARRPLAAGQLGSLGATLTTVLPAYLRVVEALTPIMRGLPGVIVTVDGRDGVGKTTLGRYLAWHFNVTLIETDLFLIPAQDYFIHLDDQVNRIIERRITSPRPVIVEGISMLQLMKRINRVPDYSIYVTNPQHSGSKLLDQRLSAYETAFAPSAKANIVVEIEHQWRLTSRSTRTPRRRRRLAWFVRPH